MFIILLSNFAFLLFNFELSMPDLELNCVQCREIYLFTERQQEEYYRRNMPQPQRCSKCRPTRRKLAQAAAAAENQLSGGTAAATRYEIVCDRCGKKDFVPFAPKAGRTVMCGACHGASRGRTRFNNL